MREVVESPVGGGLFVTPEGGRDIGHVRGRAFEQRVQSLDPGERIFHPRDSRGYLVESRLEALGDVGERVRSRFELAHGALEVIEVGRGTELVELRGDLVDPRRQLLSRAPLVCTRLEPCSDVIDAIPELGGRRRPARQLGDGSLELFEICKRRSVDLRGLTRCELADGLLDPRQIVHELRRPRLEGVERLLDTRCHALEAFREGGDRRFDVLRSRERPLDPARELVDAFVDPLQRLVRLHLPRQVGDGFLESRRVLCLVLGGRHRRERGSRTRARHDRCSRIRPLLRQCARQLEPGDRPAPDEDLAERLLRAFLFECRLGQLLCGHESVIEKDVADPALRGRLAQRNRAHDGGTRPETRDTGREGWRRAAGGPTSLVSVENRTDYLTRLREAGTQTGEGARLPTAAVPPRSSLAWWRFVPTSSG